MELQCRADIKARPLEWVWKGVIPAGRLTLLTGEQGVGKSLFALDVAARLMSDSGTAGAA
jgi:KaiC/GvpD/RAD55 family RecA-like ATPase